MSEKPSGIYPIWITLLIIGINSSNLHIIIRRGKLLIQGESKFVDGIDFPAGFYAAAIIAMIETIGRHHIEPPAWLICDLILWNALRPVVAGTSPLQSAKWIKTYNVDSASAINNPMPATGIKVSSKSILRASAELINYYY